MRWETSTGAHHVIEVFSAEQVVRDPTRCATVRFSAAFARCDCNKGQPQQSVSSRSKSSPVVSVLNTDAVQYWVMWFDEVDFGGRIGSCARPH